MILIDTHAHLYVEEFNLDRVEMIQTAINAGVTKMLLPSIDSSETEALLALELRQKTANAEYKEREAELKQIQLEKIAGNTLPLDLVDTILTINLQTIFKVFSSELENIATISVEILGGSREDLVRITNSQSVILNKLVETAKTNANFEIDRAVAEYSEVRARGERK